MFWPKRVKTLSLLILALTFSILLMLFVRGWILRPWPKPQPYLLKSFPFSVEEDLKEWEEKIFKGRVKYAIKSFNEVNCVYAKSENKASALYYKIKVDITRHPMLSWKWNVIEFPKKESNESLMNSEEDDYGARMYVIFPALFIGGTKALEYVWTEHTPKGTISSSPYSSNLKLIVLESGKNESGNWIYEERDLYQDFIKAFGEEPTLNIGAIAFMTDSDSTRSSAEAVYDDIKIEYKNSLSP